MTSKENTTKKRNPVFIIILLLLVSGGGWFGISKYLHGLKHEETDDAHISADISPVIPRMSGYVAEVRVQDNQWVKKGDTLLIIDDREAKIKLEQAQAALSTAESNLNTVIAGANAAKVNAQASRANIATTQSSAEILNAQIEAAKITLDRAGKDYVRYANLVKDHSITQQQFEQAQAAKDAAEKQIKILQAQKEQVQKQTMAVAQQSNAVGEQTNVSTSQIGVAATSIKQKEADVSAAKLGLTYTVVTAAGDGRLSKVSIQPGQFVQAGQSLFSIVHDDSKWIIANFKETQLNKMVEGQLVTVEVDAFPKHQFQAVVTSFSPATGSTFALLPPDNASGNFVKVVQRLPVKIEFTDKADSLVHKLRPGMNAFVDVHLN